MTTMATGFQTIRLEKQEGVAWLTMARPEKLNSMTPQNALELVDAFEQVAVDDEARVLVITGEGRAFSAGGDVQELLLRCHELPPVERRRLIRDFDRIVLRLIELEKPTIAMINGVASGGGCCLALACDIRIASEAARLGVVFIQRGLSGADLGATYLLPRLIGWGRACELLYTGDIIDAAEAARIGLVNRVVSRDDLRPTVEALAQRLASGPATALTLTKRAMLRERDLNFAQALELEALIQEEAMLSPDYLEGVTSFKEKRAPRFG